MKRWFVMALGLLALSMPGSASANLAFSILPSRCTTDAEVCPAPLAVMFRTTISDADFLTWHCVWDFGDDSAGEWEHSAQPPGSPLASRNRAVGPIAAHVYESPGSFTATLSCEDGIDVPASTSVNLVIDDPDVVYSGADTVCVSSSGQFSGCPSGAVHESGSDLTAILRQHMNAGRRVLLRRGETFNMVGGTFNPTADGAMLTSFGTATAKPKINGPNAQSAFGIERIQDWTISDVQFQGAGGKKMFICAQGGCTGCADGYCNTPTENVLFHEVDVTGGVSTAYLYAHSGLEEKEGFPAHKNWFIVGGSIEAAGQAYNANALFGGHNGGGVMGVDNEADTIHNYRIMCQKDFLFQHNIAGGTVTAGDDIRGCGIPGDQRSKRVIVSDNVWRTSINVKQNETTAAAGMATQYGIFERNLQFATLQIKHLRNWVVRNNVCNRGSDSCWQILRGGNNPYTLENFRVYNNSQQSSNGSGYGVVWYSELGSCKSGCVAKNNVVHSTAVGSGAAGTVVQVSGVDVSNNLNNPSSTPFVSANPTTLADFRLNGSTAARHGGTVVDGAFADIGSNCRSSSAPDIGAWESSGDSQGCFSEGGTPPADPGTTPEPDPAPTPEPDPEPDPTPTPDPTPEPDPSPSLSPPFSDDYGSGMGDWQPDNGAWNVANGILNATTTPSQVTLLRFASGELATADQCQTMKLVTGVGNAAPGFVFRATSGNLSTATRYDVSVNTQFGWSWIPYRDGNWVGEYEGNLSFNSTGKCNTYPCYVSACISGDGASKKLMVYEHGAAKPSTDPSAWANDLAGTMLDDSAVPDLGSTGRNVGLRIYDGYSAQTLTIDDWWADDYTPTDSSGGGTSDGSGTGSSGGSLGKPGAPYPILE